MIPLFLSELRVSTFFIFSFLGLLLLLCSRISVYLMRKNWESNSEQLQCKCLLRLSATPNSQPWSKLNLLIFYSHLRSEANLLPKRFSIIFYDSSDVGINWYMLYNLSWNQQLCDVIPRSRRLWNSVTRFRKGLFNIWPKTSYLLALKIAKLNLKCCQTLIIS